MTGRNMEWNNDRKDYPGYLIEPEEMEVEVVQRADQEFPFLHDTMVAVLLGKVLMAWYNCSEAEIQGKTVIRGRWSEDEGKSWSDIEVIAEDSSEEGIHYVPVTFQEYGGQAYAYITRMKAHDRPVGYECRKYVNGKWILEKECPEPILFNTLISRMSNGKLAVAGRMASGQGEMPLIPIVMTAEEKAPADWQLSQLPGPWENGEYPFPYPETALLVMKDVLIAIVRTERTPEVFWKRVEEETDWAGPYKMEMPIAASKMYAGITSDGKIYFIFNEKTEKNDRSRLMLAICSQEEGLKKLFCLRNGYDERLETGPFWHYPCACEKNGFLFISCTASCEGTQKRDGILIKIPVKNL